MTRPRLSVVIPTRDRVPLLRQAARSVAGVAEQGIEVETIVVDAAGADPAVGALTKELGARLVCARDAGAAAARNAGMAAARGEYLLFLDDDDVLLPAHAGRHLERLATRPELSGVFGQVRLADFDLTDLGEPYPLPEEVGDVFAYLLGRPQQIGSFLVRASTRETVGRFDEALWSSEDWDWQLRLALRHHVEFVAVPCLLFRQRPGGADDRLNLRRLAYLRRVFWRNVRRAGTRRPPLADLVRMFAGHNGLMAGHFVNSVRLHAGAGDRVAVRRAVSAALLSSPPHLAWSLLRDRHLAGAAARSLRPGTRPEPGR